MRVPQIGSCQILRPIVACPEVSQNRALIVKCSFTFASLGDLMGRAGPKKTRGAPSSSGTPLVGFLRGVLAGLLLDGFEALGRVLEQQRDQLVAANLVGLGQTAAAAQTDFHAFDRDLLVGSHRATG